MKKTIVYISLALIAASLSSFTFYTANWSTVTPGQVAKELQDLNTKLATLKQYSVTVSYDSFNSHQSEAVHDHASGYVIRYGRLSKSRLLGIYTVQNEQYRVTIDSANRIVKVANAFEDIESTFSYNDYIKLLGLCKSIKKSVDKSYTAYRFETRNTEGLMAQEVFLQNGMIKQVYAYYSNEHSWRENNVIKKETIYPKLHVVFGNFNQKPACTAKDFSLDGILIKKDAKLYLAPGYSTFKLIDGRIKP